MNPQRIEARALFAGLAIALLSTLSACGDSGGGPASAELPLMFDSLGRQVAEADFGRGDPEAAGADGIAFDGGALADAQVTLTDAAGTTRTTTTDASGYWRVDIKPLRPPFLLKVRRADGSEWQSASADAPRARGFLTLNASGLTDRVVGDAPGPLGPDTLAAAKARLRTALAVPLINAGLDPATYDPVSTPLQASGGHASFLRSLGFNRSAEARTLVVAVVAGQSGGFADGAAADALFNLPGGVALDAAGDLYVADTGNHRIRKITRSGVVSTLAGNGSQSHADGAGASARFNSPNSVAVDSAGNVYVADTGNNVIRKVTAAGVVTTLAGSGVAGYADGIGAAAMFDAPFSIAVDGEGNLVVSDRGNDSIRKLTPAGVVTTLAGSGPVTTAEQFRAQGFHEVRELTVDPAGLVYVNATCRATGDRFRFCLLTIAPDGSRARRETVPGLDAKFVPYGGLAVDGAADVYTAYRNTLVKLTPAAVQTVLVGDETADPLTAPRRPDRFNDPKGMVLDADGSLIVADTGNSTIKRVLP